MTDLEQLRAAYDEVTPDLKRICADLKAWLTGTCRRLGIHDPRIEARVKTPHSFLLKAYRRDVIERRPWSDPLVEASDKVGARADLVYEENVTRLAQEIKMATDVFEVLKEDVKRESTLGVDRLGYHGIHFDVRPVALPEGMDPAHAICEIQLRTNAQAAWSMGTHDLIYKAPVEPGDRLRRQVNRLTALLELFDEEVTRVRTEMMGKEGYPSAILIGALEAARMRYIAEPYDRALTRDIVDALVGDIDGDTAHQTAREIEQYRELRDDKLAAVVGGTHNPVLAQPESILVFMRLERNPFEVVHTWVEKGLPPRLLEELAAAWFITLPPWP